MASIFDKPIEQLDAEADANSEESHLPPSMTVVWIIKT